MIDGMSHQQPDKGYQGQRPDFLGQQTTWFEGINRLVHGGISAVGSLGIAQDHQHVPIVQRPGQFVIDKLAQ